MNKFIGKWRLGENIEFNFLDEENFEYSNRALEFKGHGKYIYNDEYVYFQDFAYMMKFEREGTYRDIKSKYIFFNDKFRLFRDEKVRDQFASGEYIKEKK